MVFENVVVTVPDGVTSIGGTAFANKAQITKVILPEGITHIYDGEDYGNRNSAFSPCPRLSEINLPNSLVYIGRGAFKGTSLYEINLPDNIYKLGDSTFSDCKKLVKIHIPGSVTTWGSSSFDGCSAIEEVTIGSGITTIPASTFSECSSLAKITIPDSITNISNDVFYKCYALKSITLSANISSFGASAFTDSGLTDIYYTGTQAQWESITGLSDAGIPAGCTIHYEYTPT